MVKRKIGTQQSAKDRTKIKRRKTSRKAQKKCDAKIDISFLLKALQPCPKSSRDKILGQLAVVGDGVDIYNSKIRPNSLGLFAGRDFKKGEPVTEFYGKIELCRDTKNNSSEPAKRIQQLFPMDSIINGKMHQDGTPIGGAVSLLGFGGGAMAQMCNKPNDFTNATLECVDSDANMTILHDFLTRGVRFEHNAKMRNERTVFLRATKKIAKGDEICVLNK